MQPFRFGIVGAGWRAEFFLRIVQALPEWFEIAGMVVRNQERGRAVEERWGVTTHRTPEALLDAVRPEFWVSSVAYAQNFAVSLALLEAGLPIFTETPPAGTLEEMYRLWDAVSERGGHLQVAEQFHRQPLHAARIAAVEAGRIGATHKAYVSLCHGYHGTSLIRRYLGLGFEDARIVGMGWADRSLDFGGRSGPPADQPIKEETQQIALLDFGGRQAVFDFVGAQYFSPIRTQRVCVRGERGEIVDHTLFTNSHHGHPVQLPFQRQVAGANGNLEGFHLKGIQLGEKWIYHNPTAPARLSDEEIAIADLLHGFGKSVRGESKVYPLAEAMQDHYLGLMIAQACRTGEPVTTTRQPWAA
jgi:predicted dehydrogenase